MIIVLVVVIILLVILASILISDNPWLYKSYQVLITLILGVLIAFITGVVATIVCAIY